jgi:hypothetical protein
LLWIPLVESLQPIPHAAGDLHGSLGWCLPAGVLGVLLALVGLSGIEPFLGHLDPGTRWAGEAGALTVAAPAMQAPMVLGAWIFGGSALDLLAALPDILCLDLRLAGTAFVTLALPIPTVARSGLFLGAVWLAPALVPVAGPGARLAPLLDPALALRSPGPGGLLSSLGVATASVLVARLLRAGAGRAVRSTASWATSTRTCRRSRPS